MRRKKIHLKLSALQQPDLLSRVRQKPRFGDLIEPRLELLL